MSCIRTNALEVQKAEPIGCQHRGRRADQPGIRLGQSGRSRRRPLVSRGPPKIEAHASEDLNQAQISQRVKVIDYAAQCRAASLTAMVARLTSIISSSDIGDSFPALIAPTTAATQR